MKKILSIVLPILLRGHIFRRIHRVLVTIFSVLGLAAASQAQLTFTLSPLNSVFIQGGMVSLSGTLTLSSTSTESYDLLGTSANITGPSNTGLTVDDNDFFLNLPISLAPGETYTNSINVIAGSNASTGVYTLVYQVDGQGTTTSTSASGAGTAQLRLNAANASAPEPGTLALALFGIPLFAAVYLHRQMLCIRNNPAEQKFIS